MLLSIIILSYNTEKLTLQTLESVIADVNASLPLKNHTEIIVVDNASRDGSVPAIKKIRKAYPKLVELIENDQNVGFPKGNNIGINASTGKYILLLNSDTIIKPGALETLVRAFERTPLNETTAYVSSHHGELDRLGIVSAQLFNEDGSVQQQGGSLPTFGALMCHMLLLDDLPIVGGWLPSTQHTGIRGRTAEAARKKHPADPEQTLVQEGWVGGAAMMLKREVVHEIGLLDEGIFMYGEDVEYCLRARAHHWDVAVCPAAHIIHLGSASSSSGNAIKGEFKGYLHIWRKHFSAWQFPLVRLVLQLGALLRWFIFGTMVRNPVKARVYAQLWREL
ncbi:MAG TPA: glycosyltransferase family 2 protein [Vitreimonas sp.]|nr:glycosyltransferase family 2 protein [Vitreimonas sp.]